MQERGSSIIGGFVLVLIGIFFLAAQNIPNFMEQGWPFIVIGVGLAMLLGALFSGTPALAIPACVVGGIGGLLLYQNLTHNWESWSYAWALIPGFVGVGRILCGILKGQSWSSAFGHGSSLLTLSFVLFIAFWAFLGEPKMEPYWPVLLIVAGLALIIWPMFRSRPTP